MAYRILTGEKLLIRPTDANITPTWNYKIMDNSILPAVTLVLGDCAATFLELELTRATYIAYKGKSLLLKVWKDAHVEEAYFLISGSFDMLDDLNIIKGLLGENRKETQTEHQDGYLKAANVGIYTSNALSALIDTYALSKDYVIGWTPDKRYHIEHEKIVT